MRYAVRFGYNEVRPGEVEAMDKVVLVDDESLIVEGLRKVVDWAGPHCQVAAAAHDAASGARAIREHRPDILFTDIKMPG